ncbi:MAG: hypothetical protein LBL94_05175 [Prevotellaceae bacterium]|jgi:hypothetical protein|nr:hypothetical protein [Prevotellaceae bacterium]
MKPTKKISIALIANFLLGIIFIACNKEDVTQPVPSEVLQEESFDAVPFFEVAKGDTISKTIYREKPKHQEDIQVLFSSESEQLSTGNSLAKAIGQSSGAGYIANLMTSVRSSNDAPATMTSTSFCGNRTYYKIPVDLNEGAGGKWIYLYYTKTSDVDYALINLSIKSSSTLNILSDGDKSKLGLAFANNGWTDLNEGAGGAYINIQGKRVLTVVGKGNYNYHVPGVPPYTGNVITDIMVVSSGSRLYWNTYLSSGWTLIDDDLNKGAGGKYIYLCHKFTTIY